MPDAGRAVLWEAGVGTGAGGRLAATAVAAVASAAAAAAAGETDSRGAGNRCKRRRCRRGGGTSALPRRHPTPLSPPTDPPDRPTAGDGASACRRCRYTDTAGRARTGSPRRADQQRAGRTAGRGCHRRPARLIPPDAVGVAWRRVWSTRCC
ncbi:hypothetical protein I4F81_007258 [Pyropia yezoensis]|uniref:Uncharacterized protein n=1 Tax=Pyropia yezoensis TaxID=2788 RepID=A0ACC3C437_PYRYE|nr:hypothetical protein I4F81_007258 [Neopyropia yezoensis]